MNWLKGTTGLDFGLPEAISATISRAIQFWAASSFDPVT